MSKLPLPIGVRTASLLSAALVSVGCGATGLDWVGEAHLQAAESRAAVGNVSGWQRPPPVPGVAESNSAVYAHPRLARTITLGSLDAASYANSTSSEPGSAHTGVSVTINNYIASNAPASGYGYVNFGSSLSQRTFSTVGVGSSFSRANSSGPQPGQSWPAISDHGTSFPFRSAPASPWARAQ